MGRHITVSYPPRKIISLVPSQTELLFDLGLEQEIVGITKFCIHPKERFKKSNKIGGTKTLDLQKIRALKADLIIGNKEENDRKQIEDLMQDYPVWMSDIETLPVALLLHVVSVLYPIVTLLLFITFAAAPLPIETLPDEETFPIPAL
jgi:hypothetical protein